MPQRLYEITAGPRFNAMLLSAFAAMGVLLAAVGLFGVMSFLVSQRRREIGVRVALGATPGRIISLTLQHAAGWTATGLVLGGLGSMAVVRLLRPLLFEAQPSDPAVVAAALFLLCVVALIASAGPARHAARLDPLETLRQE